VHIREMVKAFNALGHTVDIVGPAGISNVKTARTGSDSLASRCWKCCSRFMPELFFEMLELVYNFYAYSKIYKAFSKKKYDMIYERYAILGCAGVHYAKKHNIPIVLELSYTSFTPILRKRSRVFEPVSHAIDRYLFRNADGNIVVSSYLKKHLIELGVKEGKIIFLPNAADTDFFRPDVPCGHIRERYGLHNKKVIGFVGGLNHVHGLDFLFDIIPDVLNSQKEAVFFLIGDGVLRGHLEKRIQDMGMGNKVFLAGNVPHSDLPAYVSVFDIAVVPDSNEYGSPMKIFEYMAMAKPVVAPVIGPVTDAINDGKEGFLFPRLDGRMFAQALISLLENSELRRVTGAAGRDKVEKNYTWMKNAEQVDRFCKKMPNSAAA
jgi:glycosyltransferase involved in cell wall biosynthesis